MTEGTEQSDSLGIVTYLVGGIVMVLAELVSPAAKRRREESV
jgi:hypothetical protein